MAEGNGLTLSLELTMSAPREVVYRALTEPDELAKWWGPKGFTSPSVDFDPQVGGSYRIAMQPPDGELFHLSGEFKEVEPPSRLGYTFRWDPPNPDDRETVATLELEALGDETKVVLTHGEFSTEERLSLHEGGWTDSFDRLGQCVRLGLAPAPLTSKAPTPTGRRLRERRHGFGRRGDS